VRGGNRVQLTHNGKEDRAPSYSPDGKRIAYWADEVGHDAEIYTVAAEGGSEFRATNNATDDLQPSYSPNGNKLADTCAVGATRFICTMQADGRGRSQVTDHGTGEEDGSPSWGSRP
jgi:Tol biopolymer transport system component